MAESNADVYASFGVTSAVVAGESPSEHDMEMLELNVAARDGDDAIELNTAESDDPYGSDVDPFGQEPDEERTQVRVSDEEDSEESEEAPDEEADSTEDTPDEGDEEFSPLEDIPQDLNAVSEQLGKHEEGLQEMIQQAAERGLSEEMIVRIQEEYLDESGISEEAYEALAKAGYSRNFVDSYIRGQEALVDAYVAQVKDYAGGAEQFDSLLTHLETSNPEAAESLMNALESRDLSTVKAIINLAGQSRAKTFGKKPARTVTAKATPAKPQAPKVERFESHADMIKAMSDPRYQSDAKFRAAVEAKVWNSEF